VPTGLCPSLTSARLTLTPRCHYARCVNGEEGV
jgi:hypothetical protein